MIPSARILKHKGTGDLFLVHFALHPVVKANVAWGMRERFSSDEFRHRGLDAVIRSLHEFPLRKNAHEQTKVFRITDAKDQIQDAKDHLSIGVRFQNSSTLILTPSDRERGGYIGRVGDEIKLELPSPPEKFFEGVEAAFELCS